MTLQEKILYCRKKAGLSQEALAEKMGVSRQAISKWETGDAVPEISKLLLLGTAFGVTTDWLLSSDEPEDKSAFSTPTEDTQQASTSSWVEAVPGVLGRLLRRYGWLFGVDLAIAGALFAGIGGLGRYMFRKMFDESFFGSINVPISGGTLQLDEFDMISGMSNASCSDPGVIMGTAVMVFGIILMIAGIVLAIYLKKRSNR